MFPPEIWLIILKKLDRRTLMEMRLVSRFFYDIVEEYFEKNNVWRKLCDEDILFECKTLTMQRAHPYELIIHQNQVTDPALWRGTFFSHKKWRKAMELEEKKDSIVPLPTLGEIKCISTFDKYIAVAFSYGTINVYTIDDINIPFYMANHDNEINQIEFWYSSGDILIVSLDVDHGMRFWDINKHIEIATAGFFANSISTGECRHFCLAEMDGILTSYEKVDDQIIAGPTLSFRLQNEEVLGHCLDGKNMTALTYHEGHTKMYLYHGLIENGKLNKLLMDQEKDFIELPDDLNNFLERISMPTILFFFVIGAMSVGSTNYYEDEWNEFQLSDHFGSNVISMALHAQVLMFGLENGAIHLLWIKDYQEILELQERIKNSRKIQVDDKPIVNISVLEVNKNPCIVAHTEEKVHLINFY
ncbi:uncharacterized protein LOC103580895 isoform X2 [Microplitis demolitor]|nr:uncharacterized protein LOC103580895 isoform X2 [Microplitis demolitor]